MNAKGKFFEISHRGESVNVEFDRFIDMTRAWSDNTDVLRDGKYSVRSDVSVDSFRAFCDYINQEEIDITQRNCLDLRTLAEEFKCKRLQEEIQQNLNSVDTEGFEMVLEVMKIQKWMARQEKEHSLLRQMFSSIDDRLTSMQAQISTLGESQKTFEERLNTITEEINKKQAHLEERIDDAEKEFPAKMGDAIDSRIDDVVKDIAAKEERVQVLQASVDALRERVTVFDTKLSTLEESLAASKTENAATPKTTVDESAVADLITSMKAIEMRIVTAEQYIIAGHNKDNTHDSLIDSVKSDVHMLKQMMSVSDNFVKSLTKSLEDRSLHMEAAIRTNSDLIDKLMKNKAEVQSWIQQTTVYFDKEVTPYVNAMKRNKIKEARKSCGPIHPQMRPTSFDPDAIMDTDVCGPAPPFWMDTESPENGPPGLETVMCK